MEFDMFKDVDKDKDHVVVWSGGCDSTLLLDMVSEKFGTYEKPIIAFSIYHHILDNKKLTKESEAREKFLSELKSRGLHIIHKTLEIKSDSSYKEGYGGLPQAFLWALNILPYIKNGSNVYFGYIRNDDFWHMGQYFEEMVRAGSKLMGKEIKVHYPLEYHTKEHVIAELGVRKLYDYVWWCEMSNEKGGRYNECVPCKTHSMTMVPLAIEGCEWA